MERQNSKLINHIIFMMESWINLQNSRRARCTIYTMSTRRRNISKLNKWTLAEKERKSIIEGTHCDGVGISERCDIDTWGVGRLWLLYGRQKPKLMKIFKNILQMKEHWANRKYLRCRMTTMRRGNFGFKKTIKNFSSILQTSITNTHVNVPGFDVGYAPGTG